MTTATSLPSIPQCVARSNDGHRKALRLTADALPLCGTTSSDSHYRGMRVVSKTLARWGCTVTERTVDDSGRPVYTTTLTDRGRELLAALDAKWAR